MTKFLVTVETKGSTKARRDRGYKTSLTVEAESMMAAIIQVRRSLKSAFGKIITATPANEI